MKTIIRTALFTAMLIPIVAGVVAAMVVCGGHAGFTGMTNCIADLFDRWS